jgi:ornithine cyclodeaminase
MEIHFLNAAEVRQALPMNVAVEAMKEAFAQFSKGEARVPLRGRIEVPKQDGITLFMPAMLDSSQDMAIKIVSVFPRNPQKDLATIQAVVIAIDTQSGRPVAIMEGASLTAIRTGAASGAATDLLARPESKTAAIFGSGVQARTQLEAVCTVREITEVFVFSLDEEGLRIFVDEMRGRGPIPDKINIAQSPQEAVATADIICTATTSTTPVFDHKDIKPGTHINAVGSFTPEMQEINTDTVRAAFIVVDSREAALAEAGDLIIPLEQGEIEIDNMGTELGEIVLGEKPGRTDEDQITLFKSVGIAVQDVIAASHALKGAQKARVGQILDI